MVAIAKTLEPEEKAAAKGRKAHGGPRGGKLPSRSKTRDKVAASTGMSGRTLEKAKAVVEAAEAEPKKFGPLAEKIDRGLRKRSPS